MTTTILKSAVTEPDAIEKHFCVKFDKVERHAMSKEHSQLLMNLYLSEKTDNGFHITEL